MMTACKPDPINNEGDDNNDTIQEEEPIVKKYLVREYIIDKNKPIFIISAKTQKSVMLKNTTVRAMETERM